MRRAVQYEVKSRRSERRLEEVEAELAAVTSQLRARDSAIATLKQELETMHHALDIAQQRVWRPERQQPTLMTPEARALLAPPSSPPAGGAAASDGMADRVCECTLRPATAPARTAIVARGGTMTSSGGKVSAWREGLGQLGLGQMVVDALFEPERDDRATPRHFVRALPAEALTDEAALAAALGEGGLLERIAERLMPVLRQLDDGA